MRRKGLGRGRLELKQAPPPKVASSVLQTPLHSTPLTRPTLSSQTRLPHVSFSRAPEPLLTFSTMASVAVGLDRTRLLKPLIVLAGWTFVQEVSLQLAKGLLNFVA